MARWFASRLGSSLCPFGSKRYRISDEAIVARNYKLMKGQQRLILDTILLGVVGALSARLFMILLHGSEALFMTWLAGYQPPGLPQEGGVLRQVIGPHGLWLVPVVTTLGGFLSGLIVYVFAPETEGHGTDTAVKAFHHLGGRIRARVPFIKMLASAITIGSGGAAGREGPTALISAGIGSLYGSLERRSDEERRLLALIGMAAGLSAIFRSPIGTAMFAIEVLYSDMEFDGGALLYTLLGSVVAYAVNGVFVGWQPLFDVPADLTLPHFFDYLWYIILGAAAGLVATLIPTVFYRLRDGFEARPIPPHFKPALGGLGIGLLAIGLPQVLGGGYGWIQEAIDGRLSLIILLVLIFAKLLAFSLTVSSGGSGGVFAPSLYVGAMLGGLLAQLFHQPSAAFVVVGMAAVFAGAARVPVASMLMVTEMTGGYHLLPPAALAVILSYLIQVSLSSQLKYRSLYEAQVPGRADSPAHHAEHLEAAIHLLNNRRVSVPDTVSHLDLRDLLASGISLDLPDGKRLALGKLKKKSPYVGKSVQENFPVAEQEDFEVVAVFRQGHTLLPHSGLVLKSDDRLLVLTTKEVWKRFESYFAPLALQGGH
jgi:CIC family chloride channel protein